MTIKKIILIVILSTLFIVDVYTKQQKLQTDVSLIVNLNNNNKYNKGSPCGASELTCNNIDDALAYFNNIAVDQPANYPQSLIYQKLNLLLADGVYYQNGSLELYQYNVSFSPLNSGVGGVVFDGSYNQGSVFSVNVTDSEDDGKYSSYVQISNIQFQNYNQSSIVFVQTSLSFTNLTISNCSFSNINLTKTSDPIGISSIINVNQFTGGQTPPTTIFNSFIIIENSNFDGSISLPSNGGLVNCYNSVLSVKNTFVNLISTGSVFRGAYSNIVVKRSTFTNITSSIALIYSFNSYGYYEYNLFASNNASTSGVGGAILEFQSLNNNKYTFSFTDSYVFNNTGYNSMITSTVEGEHPYEIPRNLILSSSFINNTLSSTQDDLANSIFTCSVDYVIFRECEFQSKLPYQYDIISSFKSNVTFTNSYFSPSSVTCSGVTSYIEFFDSPSADSLKLSCVDYCIIENNGYDMC